MFEEIEKYKSLDFFARQVVEGFITGMHKSPFHGFSVEFAEHRQYNAGESTRNIDWKLYGRTDKLFTKRFEEETNLRCQLVIDHSRSMLLPIQNHGDVGNPNKITFACYGAAVLSELLMRQRDAFGLSLISNGIDLQTETHSNRAHQHNILQLLEQELKYSKQALEQKSQQTSSTAIAGSLHILAEQLHRRSLVVIFTDALVTDSEHDALMDALRHLRHCRHEVLLFHTMHHDQEILLDYDDRPTEFIDLENGRRIKVQPGLIAQQYQQKISQQTADLKKRAIQYRVDYIPVDVGKGFEQILVPYLLKRGRHY